MVTKDQKYKGLVQRKNFKFQKADRHIITIKSYGQTRQKSLRVAKINVFLSRKINVVQPVLKGVAVADHRQV